MSVHIFSKCNWLYVPWEASAVLSTQFLYGQTYALRYIPGGTYSGSTAVGQSGIALLHMIGCYNNPGEALRWH